MARMDKVVVCCVCTARVERVDFRTNKNALLFICILRFLLY